MKRRIGRVGKTPPTGKLRFARRAERDFESIGDFLAPRDPLAAARILKGLRQRCRDLAAFPLSCPEIGPPAPSGLRRLSFGTYIVLYFPEPGGILVVRVVHAARDLAAVLFELTATPEPD